ncbi:hypothetical protein BIU92_06100 [Curtobacterium sp. MCBA15_003]|nr:hypothetical protein BIU92_06100 [Curtobacterium sp. MCBA15_003]OII32094.1 hypothetical protein BIU94_01645 [Curtobacterium sp. MMLR14_006]
MVRHLEDVDGPGRQHAGGAQPSLRRLPQVAEQDPGEARRAGRRVRRTDREHDARVVAGRTVTGTWPHHPPRERPEDTRHPVVRPADVGPGAPEVLDDPVVRRAAGRPHQGGVDRSGDGVDRTDVVAVEVREDEQVDPRGAEQVEARPEPFRVVAGVHERHGVAAPEQHRVALPDVARRDRPVPRHRATDDEHRDRHGGDPDHDDQRRREQEPPRGPSPDQDRRGDARTREDGRGDPDRSARPGRRGVRQRRRPAGDPADGCGGDPGDGSEHLRADRGHRREDAGREPDDRDDGGEGFREQVRRHGVGGQRRRQRDRHRPAGDLGGDGDREGGGHRCPDSTGEQVGQGRPEHDDPARGEHGQREREGPCDPRVGDEHPGGGEGDERHAPHRAARQVHHEHHDGHHRRAHDRRIGADEHHERQEHADGHGGPHHPRQAAGPPEHHDESDHDRAVGSGDGGQVRQGDGLHRGLGVGVEPGPVPDRHAAEQCCSGLGQTGRGAHEGLPGGVGRTERSPGRHGRRRAAQERHDGGRRARAVELQRSGAGDVGTGRQHGAGRVVARGYESDGDAETGDGVRPLERADDRPVTGDEVAGQDRLDLDACGAVRPDDGVQRLRGPAGLRHRDRHGEQRGERGGHEDQRGDDRGSAARPSAEQDAAHDGEHDRDRPDDRCGVRRTDEQGDDDPGDTDGSRHAQVGRTRGEVHASLLRPARDRAARRSGRRRCH